MADRLRGLAVGTDVVADPLRPLYTYLDRVDAGDIDATGALFTEDGVYDILNTEHRGPADIVRYLRTALSAWERTSHHASNPLVDVDGDTARISATLYAYHSAGETVWHFWGRYTQRLVRRGDGWAIAHMALIGMRPTRPAILRSSPAIPTAGPSRRDDPATRDRRRSAPVVSGNCPSRGSCHSRVRRSGRTRSRRAGR